MSNTEKKKEKKFIVSCCRLCLFYLAIHLSTTCTEYQKIIGFFFISSSDESGTCDSDQKKVPVKECKAKHRTRLKFILRVCDRDYMQRRIRIQYESKNQQSVSADSTGQQKVK